MKALRFLFLWSAANAASLLAIFLFAYFVIMADAPPHVPHEGGEGDWYGAGEFIASAMISIGLTVVANFIAAIAWLIQAASRRYKSDGNH